MLLLSAAVPATALAQEPYVVASPDGSNQIQIEATETGLSYRVSRRGKTIIAASAIGLSTDKGGFGSEVISNERAAVDEIYRPVAGKASQVPDRYSQLVLHLQRPANGHRFDLVAPAYDDGVALRFLVP